MTRIRWIAVQVHEALAWQGILGGALLCACAMFFLTILRPLEIRIANEPSSMSAPGASSASTQGDPADTARTRLDQFYAYLDSGKTIEDQLAEVYVAGETSGLILKRAEYRLSGESSGRIARYEVTLPVTATYPQVRHFVNTVLGVLPSAALQSVSFQKKRITERNVEAEVVFRFYIAKRP